MTPYEKMILQAIVDDKTIEQRPILHPIGADTWFVAAPRHVLEGVACGWAETHKYFRIAPETIQIGDYAVPKPESVLPALGCRYYFPQVCARNMLCGVGTWDAHEADRQRLSRGLVHLTPEAAEQHAKALIAISGGTV